LRQHEVVTVSGSGVPASLVNDLGCGDNRRNSRDRASRIGRVGATSESVLGLVIRNIATKDNLVVLFIYLDCYCSVGIARRVVQEGAQVDIFNPQFSNMERFVL
jgi:hypothetical protein